ncbi:MAG: Gfo/Idh/MocA family oxidoreductase [Nitrososphaerota archaeon]|nr:Gfo/Idh/MocA family oxidoreductase [Nitrososphaerota archaeon]MDG6968266.1 Gfo/Idh/MocA family oxidoreductase [Nitrososphaerota archaeon]MDG6975003.1 Gfo/Idh/MocA family oxidoreductase [Nitrososphaerota archaeon]MDG7009706.1 Gfo/Idh/MocA family oxidoreductase [Nitrososphaerota archaeon]MDG7019691.1 Gfo/Idh/MocA family oxidoreductase [Nitrososphaerota archaeon]
MARVGVVGTGGWGKNHVRVLNELQCLAAVCDMDRERVETFSKKFHVPGYTSLESMLEKEKLDGVTICTPASTHFKVAMEALARGMHIFVEKPMTTTVADGEALIEAAKKADRALTVGFIERFNPPITALKQMISEGKMGDPILLEFHRENRRGASISDVGIVKDASVHDIDTACWLFDDVPKVVYARVGSMRVPPEHEDFATVLLGFSGQKTAFLVTNWITPNRVRTLSAVFSGGVVDVDFVTQQTSIHEGAATTVPTRPYQEPLMLELKEFVTAIQEKRQPLVTGRDALNTLRVAEGVLASSSSGAPIYLG